MRKEHLSHEIQHRLVLIMKKPRSYIIINLVSVGLFLLLSCNSLGGQGLYFDELHQAIGSFAYIGKASNASLAFHNIPIMNMNYSGAIKTAIYGIYLRIVSQSFNVISWRLVGIIIVAAGLLLFGLIVNRTIKSVGLVAFYFLIITDNTVLLTTRHDWGPTAIALFLRIVMIAIWLKAELSNENKPGTAFGLFFMLGISMFEKLSAVVLIIPLLFMVFQNRQKQRLSHVLAVILGALSGGSLLIFANIYSYIKNGNLISLQFTNITKIDSFSSFILYAKEYLSLGEGNAAQSFILGINSPANNLIELITISLLLLLIIFYIFRHHFSQSKFRTIGILIFCYFVTMIQTYFLPQQTWIHHWIIGTPFQYAAIALFLSELEVNKLSILVNNYQKIMGLFLAMLIFSRIYGLVSIESALSKEIASPLWDKSQTLVGEFAAAKSKDAFFVAGDWGIVNQLICFMNGDRSSILQLDWNNLNVEEMVSEVNHSNKTELYVIFPTPSHFVSPAERLAVLRELSQSLTSNWHLQPVDTQIARFSSFEITKYQKMPINP
jgi:hypothetical protein